jgi:hypothetical protein
MSLRIYCQLFFQNFALGNEVYYMLRCIKAVVVFFVLTSSLYAAGQSVDEVYRHAQELEKQGHYKQACQQYSEAGGVYSKKGNLRRADACRVARQQLEKVLLEYPYTRTEVAKLIEENFPDLSQEDIEDWVDNEVLSRTIDGEKRYYENFIENLKFRNIRLMHADARFYGPMEDFFNKYNDIVFRESQIGYPTPSWQVYTNPITFLGTGKLSIPRNKLPEKGVVQFWLPLPIKTSAQGDVRVISITPEEYVKLPPSIEEEIGLAYLEVPVSELKGNLDIEVQFTFSHYEQSFDIDPERIGQYDYEDGDYIKYTSSQKNINITPEIVAEAKKIVEGEENPYHIAKAIYTHIIDKIAYSVLPHLTFDVLEIPESEFVYQNKFGDSGAQSIYFVSLCRALGVPARTVAGWQLCPGYETCHFWAEFYLPNYGWVPADMALGQVANYLPNITKEQRQTFKNFFFTNQDPYRWTIQENIDIPVHPEADEPIFLRMAVQYPAVVSKDSENNLSFSIFDYWKLDLKPMYR